MRVLFFITSLSINSGGPSRSVPMMAKGISELGIDVILLTLYSNDMNVHALTGTTVKVVPLMNGFRENEVEQIIRDEGVDIVQLQSVWEPEYHRLAIMCKKRGIPYLFTPRGMLEPWSLKQKWLKKKLALLLYQKRDLNDAICIYTTSEMEATNIRALGIRTEIAVIPNGIDTDGYPCRTSKDGVKKQILFLSRIHKKKGIELLIEAWKNIRDSYPDWEIIIVGNGEEEYIEGLKRAIEIANLGNCISILSPVFGPEKVQLYHSSALFVLPSYSENFGMVVAEALSCGVPVITSEFTPWQILNRTKSGWCITLSSNILEETLRKAIDLYPDGLYEMGQNGSKVVFDNFDYRSVAVKTVALYEWILCGGNKPDSIV